MATWAGFVYVAFVIDAFSRRIVGWRAARSMTTALVLDAVEHAFFTRAQEGRRDLTGLIAHNDAGAQTRFNRWTQHLDVEVFSMGRPPGWAAALTGRAVMRSPGRPPVRRDLERAFWGKIAEGLTSEDAAMACGVSGPVGSRWFVTLAVCHRSSCPRCRGDIFAFPSGSRSP